MAATSAAVVGVSGGKRLLTSSSIRSYSSSDNTTTTTTTTSTSNKLLHSSSSSNHHHTHKFITAKKLTNFGTSPTTTTTTTNPSNIHAFFQQQHHNDSTFDIESSLEWELVLLLQKSILEKQWNLSCQPKLSVIGSGISARHRRSLRKSLDHHSSNITPCPQLLPLGKHNYGYVKGVISDQLLTHHQVVHLSTKIKAGLSLDDYKSKLKKRLGYEPSDEHLASSLRISRAELHSKRIECSLAREKLVMSNVRLVMSIAKKYDNMGAEMADLVQGGLIGLVRGIEKFDSSKGFKISTYVYWWIRQGISRTLAENSRTLRLPIHLHERLRLIRNAKIRLEDKGITPSIEKIADYLNMSQKKVRNATEAIGKVFSLDKEAFPSLNGLPGETLHSYIADTRLENNPWHGVNELTLKDEVNNLIKTTLREREQDIVRLYYGLDKECLTWEDISRRMGLSRERVRQVGLVALEKLKHAARKKRMDALLLQHH